MTRLNGPQILMTVIGQRQRIIEDTDGSSSQVVDLTQDGDDAEQLTVAKRGPSKEALEKFFDYSMYILHSRYRLAY